MSTLAFKKAVFIEIQPSNFFTVRFLTFEIGHWFQQTVSHFEGIFQGTFCLGQYKSLMLHWNTKWNKRELDWWPKFASFCHQVSPPAKQLWQVAPSLLFFNFSFQSSSISQNIIQMHKLKSEEFNLFWSQKKKSENKRNTKDGVTLMLELTFFRTFNYINKTIVFYYKFEYKWILWVL